MLLHLIAILSFTVAYAYQIPNCDYIVEEILDYGNQIKLDNGSKWKVSETDVYKIIMSWNKNDKVTVYPNTSWFVSYNYYLKNEISRSMVGANIVSPPLHRGPKTHWVQALNKFSGHLFLDDGSSWKIASEDWALFERWKNGDSVIIGLYKNWVSTYNYILIDVEMNCYVRATPF